jgi:acetolactate synthase-1/2/3 large subunit
VASSKYSDQVVEWLAELGYTHCFFVAGGNIMHLLDSVRTRMTCVPFVHEVGAAIAVENFNATRDEDAGRAFALVTAGPGLTNAVTGITGAYQESRELLILGGQVKSSDLSHGAVRQRGIQEVDGVELVRSVTKLAKRIERPISREEFTAAVIAGRTPRKGPVFLEFCLDAQAVPPIEDPGPIDISAQPLPVADAATIDRVVQKVAGASRPVVLVGGGVSRNQVRALGEATIRAGIPLMTTWNGADRVPSEHPLFAGRPNTWGQRSANVLIQQADLILAVGTRLGLQQTGFAWEQFAPVGEVVQVDIDPAELEKGHPHIELGIAAEADAFLRDLYAALPEDAGRLAPWRGFIAEVAELLPLADQQNTTGEGYIEPYELGMAIAELAGPEDVVMPASSGGSFTVWMQSLRLRANQKLASDKGAASMGYGLSASIGAALANPTRRVFLAEGDGGFAQNLQELGTLAAVGLPVKVLLMANDGYASIRMTQRNYFNGAWIGCDVKTGLGLPDWSALAKAYGLDYVRMDATTGLEGAEVSAALASTRPVLIEVPIDPDQTYFPKITSAVQPDGSMRSNPLHLMDPVLDEDLADRVMPYLSRES